MCMITKVCFLFSALFTAVTKALPDFTVLTLFCNQIIHSYLTLNFHSHSRTNQDQPRGLEEPFVIPVRMDLLQHVTHPVVFPKPNSGVHHQTRYQAEGLVTHGEALGLRNVGRVVHFSPHLLYCWRVHFSMDDLHGGISCYRSGLFTPQDAAKRSVHLPDI